MALPFVIIPPEVANIGSHAFWNCESLATIVSLSTVPPAIEQDTFYRLPDVTGIGEGTATISYTLIDGTGCPHVISCNVFVEGGAGIRDIATDDYDIPAEYYDLNGRRITRETLSRGIYIKIQGKKATKILVK